MTMILANDIDITKGYYTLVYSNGEHRTIRVKEGTGNFEGKLLVGYLSGSDNVRDYTYFGEIVRGQFRMWKSFQNKNDQVKCLRILKAVKRINENTAEAGKAYALKSGNCYHCNRLLTVPESIVTGLGPDCSAKLGLSMTRAEARQKADEQFGSFLIETKKVKAEKVGGIRIN